jgi:RHS repeat-associated protein
VELTRDALGRIATRKETIGGITNSDAYTYDARGRLTKVTRGAAVIGSYAYDDNDNRISATDSKGARAASHDAQDRLLSEGGASFSYTPEGALLAKTAGTDTTTYLYDLLGALRGVTLPNGTEVTYVVDGTHRRIGKKLNGTLSKAFLYQNILPAVSATAPPYPSGTQVVAELDASGAIVSRFLYGSKPHVPDAMVRAGRTYRLVSDERGSIRLVVDDAASGAVAQRIDYDVWGNVMSDSSPGFQPFGFAGGLYDADTGLVRFGARDYDASAGRWTAKDPIRFDGAQPNLYARGRNDPINAHDPSGLLSACDVIAGGVGGYICWRVCPANTTGGAGACAVFCGAAASAIAGAVCGLSPPPTPQQPPPDSCPPGWHTESVSKWLLSTCVPNDPLPPGECDPRIQSCSPGVCE